MADVELLPLPRCDVDVTASYSQASMRAYARANVEHHTAALQAENKQLRAEVDALARENEAMRRCAIRYLRWLGVTHKPLDAALREDMANPDMCGDAALAQEDRND